jgi:hypothetical protein
MGIFGHGAGYRKTVLAKHINLRGAIEYSAPAFEYNLLGTFET